MNIIISGVSSGWDNMESQNLSRVHYGTIQLRATILQPKARTVPEIFSKFMGDAPDKSYIYTYVYKYIYIYM